MRVEIKNRFNGEIIISGKYDSINYAPEQIKEYFGYIKMCKKYIKELKNET